MCVCVYICIYIYIYIYIFIFYLCFRSENLFYRQTDSMSGAWQKVDLCAQQIAVSRSGYIWWRLHQNTVYVGTGISSKKVEGKKQVEAIRDVAYIAVDEDCGW